MTLEWTSVVILGPKIAVDGRTLDACTVAMRRRASSGEWQYRAPTREEEATYVSDEAW
jgi:hypothetical protein